MEFSQLNLSEDMLSVLNDKGFLEATPIQALVIPEFFNEKANIIGHAQTGTGKTAAFAIPIIESCTANRKIQALILTPTRELALQVCEEIYSLSSKKRLKVLAIYGGASIEQQVRNVRAGCEIIVGTPGRVTDLMDRGVLSFTNIDFFVLDEADEMLNMGFVDAIEDILKKTNKTKRMLFFSATMPDSILEIAKKYMGKYKTIKVENKEMTTHLTEQIYFEVRESDKFEALCRVLDFEQNFYGIIFCRTKIEVDDITKHLKNRGYSVDALHGDISQALRTKTLNNFKEKLSNILIATDVAARGIDVNNLTHVINYSIPQDPESYIHRIGRTGRAGNKGIAITFVTKKEMFKLLLIKKVSRSNIKQQPVPDVKSIILAKEEYLQASVNEIITENDCDSYKILAEKLLGEHNPVTLISALLRHQYQDEFLESSYVKIEQNQVLNDNVKLFIALGRQHNMTPTSLLAILNNKCDVPGRKVREVRILDAFSFITVPLADAEKIMHKLNETKKIADFAKK